MLSDSLGSRRLDKKYGFENPPEMADSLFVSEHSVTERSRSADAPFFSFFVCVVESGRAPSVQND
jgi:hypothetical protein